jgi:galactokinase
LNSASDRRIVTARAPGRIELLGNHTDYNEGFVLGAAIDRGVTVAGSRRAGRSLWLRSQSHGAVELLLSDIRPNSGAPWSNYVLGVVKELLGLGVPIGGFAAAIESDLPSGQGLSSSAALEVASAFFLLKLFAARLPSLEIAKACQRAEHNFVGVQSGLLDQVTSIFGKENHVVFFDSRREEIRRIPFPEDLLLIVCESGTERELASAPYNLRRHETSAAARALGVQWLRDVSSDQLRDATAISPLLKRRAAHIIGENERVLRALQFLEAGDAHGFGALMFESHESSRINFDNSSPELDLLVELARNIPGVLGARLTGAGFGGATVTLCQRAAAPAALAQLRNEFRHETSRFPEAFLCRVAEGAS